MNKKTNKFGTIDKLLVCNYQPITVYKVKLYINQMDSNAFHYLFHC